MNHTFVVCAYGESPFLTECLESLVNQTVKSRILVATSTPNDTIRSAAGRFGARLLINQGESGIAGDWNFAMKQGGTPLVTLAHQDDVYMPDYTRQIQRAYRKNPDAVILFTDYMELREDPASFAGSGWKETESRLVIVKRMMLFPLRVRLLQKIRWVRRRVLSFGNAICCPSVTYVRKQIPEPLFVGNMKSNIDWQAWELLSRRKGSFVYIPNKLMLHRIHKSSTTSALVEDHGRRQEDLHILRRFWPGKIPELIWRAYGNNEKYQ